MDLYDSFAAAFDTPTVNFLKGDIEVTRASAIAGIDALIEHPDTPELEREAARRALARLDGAA